ncbi:hypothetical protein EDI_322580 [Entamoeba dispar SAW760]|uniref:PPM-type phosphatase domain-containing protein n=1 Tax=Entamoeba dispar (strain ATCC PRA-260 / SAW760) TaxID=370354 RepID=B0E5T0_ENTDS|nr:uncharacterized protein EDI_322580 [Entamoeba dispar SAW760]EDR30116.1 hypothetical protein EDI_322580 [Entamoeba dispar SAW760]|eukprot:EDR30116.1 hypothetical protein EDI_322580 [Entamoeba dispar SAW760]
MKKLGKAEKNKTTKMFNDAFENSIKSIERIPVKIKKNQQPIIVCDTTPPPMTYPIFSTESIAYTSLSTYPFRDGKKIGNPICDKGKGAFFEDMAIAVLADGCGLGNNVCNASKAAVNKILESIIDKIEQCKNTKEIAQLMVESTYEGHLAIINDGIESFQIGTATVIINVIVYSNQDEPIILTLSIGDCHSYKYSPIQMKTEQLTGSIRTSLNDVSDCGGRIGPFIDHLYPDLRNANIKLDRCNDGDIIIIATDGYHDNFDPTLLDYNPIDIGIDANDWNEASKTPYFLEKKQIWIERLITSIFKTSSSMCHFVEQLGDYVTETTQTSRKFVENHPGEKLPPDPHKFPGKLDHSTLLAYKVIKRIDAFEIINSIIPSYSSGLFGGQSISSAKLRASRPKKLFVKLHNRQIQTPRGDTSDPTSLYFSEKTSPHSMSPIHILSKESLVPLNPDDKPIAIKFNSDHSINPQKSINSRGSSPKQEHPSDY